MALTSAQRLLTYGPLVWHGLNRGVATDQLRGLVTPWGTKIRVHHLVADHWAATMARAAVEVPEFVPRRSDSFVPRLIRNSTAVSMHAYGLAVDWFMNPYPTSPPGGVWTPYELQTPEFKAWVAVWVRAGFRWGGTFSRTDLPHIEWAGAPPLAAADVAPPPRVLTVADYQETSVKTALLDSGPPNIYGVAQPRWNPGFGRPPVPVAAVVNGLAPASIGVSMHVEGDEIVTSIVGLTGGVAVWVSAA